MPLHPDFKAVVLRGVTNTDGQVIGISFDAPDGSTIRFKLNNDCARHLAECMLRFLNGTNSQSEMSSGVMPSVSPQDGV